MENEIIKKKVEYLMSKIDVSIEDANKYDAVALDTREDCLERLYSIETAYIEIRQKS